jgi:hypothetical protein
MGEFLFKEQIDTTLERFKVSFSPETIICDRQTIPHWNIAFARIKDLSKDTLVFKVLIPYMKNRVVMTMLRQTDSTIEVMGDSLKCHVFFSLRTDEYYFVSPDRQVVMVDLPKQNLAYRLSAIEDIEKKEQ